jgi:formylglycine-generating enzyme required for sulfatase activity
MVVTTQLDRDPTDDEEFTNSIGLKFRLIPAGEFPMGKSDSETREWAAERFFPGISDFIDYSEVPQHRVRLTKPFYLGIHEVTQEQYERVEEAHRMILAVMIAAIGDQEE